MRARLLILLLSAFGCILAMLGLATATSLATGRQQELFTERLRDATRFASTAQLADTPAANGALRDDLIRYGEVYGVTAALVNEAGQVVASSLPPPDLTGRNARSLVSDGLAGHQSDQPPTIWPWHDAPLRVAVPVIHDGEVIGTVVIVSPTDRLRGAVGRDLARLVIGTVTGLTLLVLLALRLSRWALRPVYLLDNAAHEISDGRLSARVTDGEGPPELRRLTRSFNRMVDTVEDAMIRQREFAVNVSHQLRNPLAALMLRLDLLELDLDRGAGRRAAVQDARREAQHLRGTLDELLRFATACPARTGAGPTDITTIIRERMAAWEPMARRGGVRLRADCPAPVTAHIDPRLTASALDAVLDNAIKYSPAGGTVRVSVSVSVSDSVGRGRGRWRGERLGRRRARRGPADRHRPGARRAGARTGPRRYAVLARPAGGSATRLRAGHQHRPRTAGRVRRHH